MARKRPKLDGRSALVRRDGVLALTFVNTGSRRSRRLRDYADLLAWSVEHGSLTAADANRLEQVAAERPQDAAAGFAAAEELHALLSTIMNGRADRKLPTSQAVRELNALSERTAPRRILVTSAGKLGWLWPDDRERDLYRPLWSVVLSATDLLTSDAFGTVRRCAGEGCDVLFLAIGQGRPRRWCSDRSCGSRARSRRHYQRVTKPQRKARVENRKRAREVSVPSRPERVDPAAEESREGPARMDSTTIGVDEC
jgi:predicted RNA-binding Zn ribbon-like protein